MSWVDRLASWLFPGSGQPAAPIAAPTALRIAPVNRGAPIQPPTPATPPTAGGGRLGGLGPRSGSAAPSSPARHAVVASSPAAPAAVASSPVAAAAPAFSQANQPGTLADYAPYIAAGLNPSYAYGVGSMSSAMDPSTLSKLGFKLMAGPNGQQFYVGPTAQGDPSWVAV